MAIDFGAAKGKATKDSGDSYDQNQQKGQGSTPGSSILQRFGADRFAADQAMTIGGHLNAVSDAANAADSSLIIATQFADPSVDMFYGTGYGDDGMYAESAPPEWPSDNGGYKAATQGFTPRDRHVFPEVKGADPFAGKGNM